MLKIPKRSRVHPSCHRSRKQEGELAQKLGAKKVPASGSLDTKGDVRKKGVFRLEAKTTGAKSFSLTLEMVRKIEEAALASGELPAICVEFLGPGGKPIASVAVLPVYVLEMLTDFKR